MFAPLLALSMGVGLETGEAFGVGDMLAISLGSLSCVGDTIGWGLVLEGAGGITGVTGLATGLEVAAATGRVGAGPLVAYGESFQLSGPIAGSMPPPGVLVELIALTDRIGLLEAGVGR
jgi:hypothetical protein